MVFTLASNIVANLSVNGVALEQVSDFKYLGVYLQQNLKFDIQINRIIGKISRFSGVLFALRKTFSQYTLRTLYFAFVYSHLNFHILAWGGTSQTLIDKLSIAQNKAVRSIYGTHRFRGSITQIYVDNNLLKFEQIYKLRLATFMFKLIKLNQGVFVNLLQNYNWQHFYDTRRIFQFRHPPMRVSFNEQFCLAKGLQLWDTLPEYLRNSQSVGKFKNYFIELVRTAM